MRNTLLLLPLLLSSATSELYAAAPYTVEDALKREQVNSVQFDPNGRFLLMGRWIAGQGCFALFMDA